MGYRRLDAISPNWNGTTTCSRGGVAGGFVTRKLWVDKIAGAFPIHLSELFLSSTKISEPARTLSPSHPLFLCFWFCIVMSSRFYLCPPPANKKINEILMPSAIKIVGLLQSHSLQQAFDTAHLHRDTQTISGIPQKVTWRKQFGLQLVPK